MEYIPGMDAYFSYGIDKKPGTAALQLGANFIPIPFVNKAGKHIPASVTNGMTDILLGNGNPVIRGGVQETVRQSGRTQGQWVGALEYIVPDAKGTSLNGTRILQKVHGDGTSTWGYIVNHNYNQIIEIPLSSPLIIR
jgi:hypothetical protein